MSTSGEEQITIHLDASIKERLQAAAEGKGVEVDRYCLDAIEQELARDETTSQVQEGQAYDFEGLFAFRDALLGDRKFPGNSVDLIREAREARAAQIEGR